MFLFKKQERLLANRYQLGELIGSGAMGEVYRAQDKLLGGVTVAVKFLSQAVLNNRSRERFEQEATISALLGQRSIHIVGVKDYGVDDRNIPYYVMEFLHGENLGKMVQLNPLSIPQFLRLTRQICSGIECAHKGVALQGQVCSIIHRDIKPSNIFVVQDLGFGELVKILDFGIAKPMLSGNAKTQQFIGTMAYCSPEQIQGREIDSRSDLYSLGIVMYQTLAGEMPIMPEDTSFGGWYEAHCHSRPKPFNPDLEVPETLANLIFQCLEKKPAARPPTAGTILQILTELQSELKLPTSSPTESKSQLPRPATAGKQSSSQLKLPSLEKLSRQSSWPTDKPHQKIVFPNILRSVEGTFASLWVMLDQEDILKYASSTRYSQFVFMPTPHPMLLWISVLYHRQLEPRWLYCYLDLKTEMGQQLVRLLAEQGRYWLLFFAMQNPQRCQKMGSMVIAAKQRPHLLKWANLSQSAPESKPEVTKKLLKQELQKLKPQIIAKLEVISAKGLSKAD